MAEKRLTNEEKVYIITMLNRGSGKIFVVLRIESAFASGRRFVCVAKLKSNIDMRH